MPNPSSSPLEQLMDLSRAGETQEAQDTFKRGMGALLPELLRRVDTATPRIDKSLIDGLIAQIDARLSKQVDAVLHAPKFQQLESAWRGLKLVVDRTNFRENIKVELLSVSREELEADFEDSPELPKSGLYKHVYSNEYGVYGGKPYGALIGNFEFGPGPRDIKLLSNIAAISAMAHAPFIAAAGAPMFGLEDFAGLPNLKDLPATFEGAQYIKWRSFRETEDSRYVGLTVPRFLLRLPYDPEVNPVKSFQYRETVEGHHDRYLWGNTSFAFATRLTDSFARYRWCPNIIGPKAGGTVADLPLHQYKAMGSLETKIPTEVLVTDRREKEFSDEGFIPLVMHKDSDHACFFSANSCQKPKTYGISKEGKDAEANYRLGTQLPYLFIVSRLAHYIKVLQRQELGTFKERSDMERELGDWLKQYVLDMDVALPRERAIRPLRKAKLTVEDVEGNPGWYRVNMMVRPHFKFMGAWFDLSLVGKLDK